MKLEKLLESIRSKFSGTIEVDAPLSKYTYYRIGGPARVLATPQTIDDLCLLNQLIIESGLPFFILGWGSNLLFSDQGFPGIVIRMKKLFPTCEKSSEGILRLGASLGCSILLRKAQEEGWGDLSHFTGIPGSLGGMIAMNAGTHLGEMKKSCLTVEYMTLGVPTANEPIKIHHVSETSFSYRHNHFLGFNDIVLHATLTYIPSDPEKIKKEIDDLYQRRKQTQPVDFPSCGSVFMNPLDSGKHAWQVIDELGLRGHQIGGAQISEKHSNFIINLGTAKADDVKALIQLVKTRALNEMGITLKEEVKIL